MMTAYATSIPAIDPSMGQLVELPIDQAGTYVIQDASGAQIQLGSVQGGKSLLKPELAQHLSQHAGGYKANVGRGGYTLANNDARWVSLNTNRGSRSATSRKPLSTGTPVGQTGGLSGVHSNVLSPSASGLLSLGTRYTPSSATVFGTTGSPMSGVNQGMSGAGGTIINPAVSTGVGAMSGMGVDRDSSYRLAAAIAGTSGRGRPRGRRPLRGQFPVVPIDMVRQLGIEQQVILQPAAPVAMRNKAVLCRPLSMCRKTQANASTAYDSLSQHGVAVQTDKPSGVTELSNDKTSIGKEIQTQTTEHLMKSDESDDDEDMVPVAEVEDDQLLIKSDQPKYSCVETSTTEDMISMDAEVQTDLVDQDESKKMPAFLPIPIPVPIYVPFPVCLYARPVPYAIPYPLPCPIPIPLVFDAVSSDASLTEGHEQQQQVNLVPNSRSLIQKSGQRGTHDSPASDNEVNTQGADSEADQSTCYPGGLKMSTDERVVEIAEEHEGGDCDTTENTSYLKRRAPEESSSSDSWTSESTGIHPTEHTNPSFHQQHRTTTTSMSDSSSEGRTSNRSHPPAKRPRQTLLTPVLTSDANYHLKFSYGINAWRHWVQQRSACSSTDKSRSTAAMQQYSHLYADLLNMSDEDLNIALSQFVREVRKPNNECYVADSIFYLCLGIQEYLNENGRIVNLFGDPAFTGLSRALNEILANFQPRISPEGLLICRIEEEHLWEAKQLGSQSAEILLFTMLYYNTKHIGLRLGTIHRQLAFSQFQISESAILCHLPGHMLGEPDDTVTTLRLDANPQHPQRCPVRLYKAYFSHCPTEMLDSDNVFYLNPLYPPQLNLWFSTEPVRPPELQVILNRIKMVKEIQEAFMNSQPDGGF